MAHDSKLDVLQQSGCETMLYIHTHTDTHTILAIHAEQNYEKVSVDMN